MIFIFLSALLLINYSCTMTMNTMDEDGNKLGQVRIKTRYTHSDIIIKYDPSIKTIKDLKTSLSNKRFPADSLNAFLIGKNLFRSPLLSDNEAVPWDFTQGKNKPPLFVEEKCPHILQVYDLRRELEQTEKAGSFLILGWNDTMTVGCIMNTLRARFGIDDKRFLLITRRKTVYERVYYTTMIEDCDEKVLYLMEDPNGTDRSKFRFNSFTS